MTKGLGLSRFAVLTLTGAILSACVSTDMGGRDNGLGPRYATHRGAAAPPTQSQGQSQGQARATRPDPGVQGAYKVGRPYQVSGIWYTPKEDPDYDEVGIASWYGDAFQLRPTASGEPFDMYMPSAAHKALPLQSLVEVTNLDNGKRIQVRINDRGPFVDGRIIDLSRAAAEELGMVRSGVARVRVRFKGVSPTTTQSPIIVASNAAPMPRAVQAQTRPNTVEAAKVVTMAPIPNPPEPMRTSTSPSLAFEVQAAAFSDAGLAERVRRQLASSGEVVIRPLQRDSGVLYRVVVGSLQTESAAFAVREQLAALGFPDAHVIRPF